MGSPQPAPSASPDRPARRLIALGKLSRQLLSELRHAQRGLVLQPNLPEHEDLFDLMLCASSTMGFPPGRGFLVDGDQSTLVQVVLA